MHVSKVFAPHEVYRPIFPAKLSALTTPVLIQPPPKIIRHPNVKDCPVSI